MTIMTLNGLAQAEPSKVDAALSVVSVEPVGGPKSTENLKQVESPEDLFEEGCSCARFGMAANQGARSYMEDAYIAIEDISEDLKQRGVELAESSGPQAYFGVFDGHGGELAAEWVRDNIYERITSHKDFPSDIPSAMRECFVQADIDFHKVQATGDNGEEDFSGTTALVVFLINKVLYVANAGDCRCVLSHRGRAVPLSFDQKPTTVEEATRIKAAGGFIEDGYVNGALGCSRAIGDWHLDMKEYDSNGQSNGPLTAEPEVLTREVQDGDEFMVLGCDGLWDVFSSESAVEFARQQLRSSNDPESCSTQLVNEALNRHTADNVSVITVCFTSTPPPKRELQLSASDMEQRKATGGMARTISTEGLAQLSRALTGDL